MGFAALLSLELAGIGVHLSRREQGWVCRNGGAVSAAETLSVNLLLAMGVLQSRTRAYCTAADAQPVISSKVEILGINNIRHQWP